MLKHVPLGIVFGYQKLFKKGLNAKYITKFYTATWKSNYYTLNTCKGNSKVDCVFGGTTGLFTFVMEQKAL